MRPRLALFLSMRPWWSITVRASFIWSAPLAYAAAVSPILCPMTKSGLTPRARQASISPI